jgi:hypothetical protein
MSSGRSGGSIGKVESSERGLARVTFHPEFSDA